MKITSKLFTAIVLLACGFTVSSCSDPNSNNNNNNANYSNVKILQVRVTNIPFTNSSSAGWDSFNGPDLFFEIENSGGTVLVSSSTVSDLTVGGLPVTWNLGTALEVNNLLTQYTILLYDYDTPDPDDLIGGYYWTFDSVKSGYPGTVTLSGGSTGISIDLIVDWY